MRKAKTKKRCQRQADSCDDQYLALEMVSDRLWQNLMLLENPDHSTMTVEEFRKEFKAFIENDWSALDQAKDAGWCSSYRKRVKE